MLNAGVENCTAYLDDVVIHSPTWHDHLATLRTVLQLAKCEFGKATVTYLGKQVGRGQVRPLASKVEAMLVFPAPMSNKFSFVLP